MNTALRAFLSAALCLILSWNAMAIFRFTDSDDETPKSPIVSIVWNDLAVYDITDTKYEYGEDENDQEGTVESFFLGGFALMLTQLLIRPSIWLPQTAQPNNYKVSKGPHPLNPYDLERMPDELKRRFHKKRPWLGGNPSETTLVLGNNQLGRFEIQYHDLAALPAGFEPLIAQVTEPDASNLIVLLTDRDLPIVDSREAFDIVEKLTLGEPKPETEIVAQKDDGKGKEKDKIQKTEEKKIQRGAPQIQAKTVMVVYFPKKNWKERESIHLDFEPLHNTLEQWTKKYNSLREQIINLEKQDRSEEGKRAARELNKKMTKVHLKMLGMEKALKSPESQKIEEKSYGNYFDMQGKLKTNHPGFVWLAVGMYEAYGFKVLVIVHGSDDRLHSIVSDSGEFKEGKVVDPSKQIL